MKVAKDENRKCRWLRWYTERVEVVSKLPEKKRKKITAKTPRREEENKKWFTAKVRKDGMKVAKDGRSDDRIFPGSKGGETKMPVKYL
jgi:hypothetical protein